MSHTLFLSSTQKQVEPKAHTSQLNGEGNGTPLQYSCLENPIDGGPW